MIATVTINIYIFFISLMSNLKENKKFWVTEFEKIDSGRRFGKMNQFE